MSQKRHSKQMKRRKNKDKDAEHYQMRQYSKLAKALLAQAWKAQND